VLKVDQKEQIRRAFSLKARVYARSPGSGIMTGVRLGQPFGMPVLLAISCPAHVPEAGTRPIRCHGWPRINSVPSSSVTPAGASISG
jgi:hypothetical protein